MITALPLMAQLSFSKHLQRRKFSAHFNLQDIPITTTWQFTYHQVARLAALFPPPQQDNSQISQDLHHHDHHHLHKVISTSTLVQSPPLHLSTSRASSCRRTTGSRQNIFLSNPSSFLFQINKFQLLIVKTKLLQQSFV